MSVSLRKSMVVRLLPVMLLGLCCQLAVIWLIWQAQDFFARRALSRYEQQWKEKGEHFGFADFIPKPVPDASNFAFAPVVASSYERDLDKSGHALDPKNNNVVDRLNMEIHELPEKEGNWALGEKTDLKAFELYYRSLPARANPFQITLEPQTPAADVLLALSKYDQSIEDLRSAAALPDSRFPLDYDCDPPEGILLPHLRPLNKCAKALELRAVAELENGQSDKALADVKLIFRLMASIHNEPFDISQLIRIDMLNEALQAVWEGTQEHLWSDAQLRELDKGLAGLDFLADYESTVRGGRAFELANMEYLRRIHKVGGFFGDVNVLPLATIIEMRFSPDSVYYNNELVYARGCQDWMLPIADVKQHSVSLLTVQMASDYVDQIRGHWNNDNVLAAVFLPEIVEFAKRCGCAQSSADMARVACALERYRLATGKYPESLDALKPRFIDSVPPDVIEGAPLIYHRTGDGNFVLYSVGWNGTDDGGKVFSKPNLKTVIDYNKGDWVWTGQVLVEESPATQ